MTKKTARTRNPRILSVGPITSRGELVHAKRHINMRAALKAERDREWHKQSKAIKRWKRLNAAIKALGNLKEDT